MKRFPLLFCIVLLLATSAFSQNSGFRGRHFLLKSDFASTLLPNRSGRNLTLEVVVLRNATLSFGYEDLTKDFGLFTFEGTYTYEAEFLALSVTNKHLFLEGRFYHNDGFTAPLGIYSYGRLASSGVDIEGTTFVEDYNNVTGDLQKYFLDFQLKNLPGVSGELGWGRNGSFWIV